MQINTLKNDLYRAIISKPELFNFIIKYGKSGFVVIDPSDDSQYWIDPLLRFSLAIEDEEDNKWPLSVFLNNRHGELILKKAYAHHGSDAAQELDSFLFTTNHLQSGLPKTFEVHRYPFENEFGKELMLLAFNPYELIDEPTEQPTFHENTTTLATNPDKNLIQHIVADLNLRTAKMLVSHLLDDQDLGILVNEKGKITHVSQSFTRITGYTQDDLNAMGPAGMLDLIHPDDRMNFENSIFDTLANCHPHTEAQVRFLKKNGQYIYTSHVNVCQYRGHECLGGITFIKDLSVSQLSDTYHRFSEGLYENLLQALPDTLFILDSEGVFVGYKANDKSTLYTDPSQFLYRSYREVMPPDNVALIANALEEIKLTGHAQPFEYQLEIQGKVKYFECRMFEINTELVGAMVRENTESHVLKKQLEEQQKLYESLLQNLPGGTYRTLADKSWTPIFVSKWITNKFGYTKSDFESLNKNGWHQVIHPEDFEKVNQAYSKALQYNTSWEVEFRLKDKQGNFHWVLEKGQTIFDSKGKPLYRDGIILDINLRKSNELKLREHESIIKSYYDNAPIMMGIVELIDGITDDYFVKRGNKLAAKFCGLQADEIINVKASELGLSQDIIQLWLGKYLESEKSGKEVIFESEHIVNGQKYVLACTAKYLSELSHQHKTFAFTAQDVTQDRINQGKLIESESKLKAIADKIEEAFFMFNLETNRFEFISPSSEKIMGAPLEFFESGRSYLDHYALPEYRNWKTEALKYLERGESYTVEYQIAYDDTVKWIREKCYPVFDKNGRLIKVSGVSADITKEKEAELALKRHNAMQAKLATIASEFINTPVEYINSSINNALHQLANHLSASRAYICKFSHTQADIFCENEYVAAGNVSLTTQPELLPHLHQAAWHYSRSVQSHHYVPDINAIKNNFKHKSLKNIGIRSFLTIPFYDYEHCEGFIGFDWNDRVNPLSEDELAALGLFARMYENLNRSVKTKVRLNETLGSLERISNLAKVGGFMVDVATNKIEWSQMTYQIYGLPEHTPIDSETVYAHYKEGYHRDKLRALVERLNKQFIGYDDEFLIIDAHGNEKWVRTIATPLVKDGRMVKIYGTVQDIDHLKRTQQKLDDTRQQLESILNEMDDVMVSLSLPEQEILFITPSVKNILEIDVLDFGVKMPDWRKIIHPDDHWVFAEIDQQLSEKGTYEVQYRIITNKNNVKWIKNKGKLIYDKDFNPIRLDAISIDITKYKEYEDQLLMQSEILENVGEAVLALNEKAEIIYANKAAKSIFAIPDGMFNAHQKLHIDALCADTSKAIHEAIYELSTHAQQAKVFEHYFLNTQGQGLHLLARITPFYKQTGTNHGYILIATNISQLKEKEQQLIQSEEQSRMLARRYQNIINNESIYIIKTDAEGNYTFINEYFKKVYGVGDEFIGKRADIIVIPEDLPKMQQAVELCFKNPNQPQELILRKRRPDDTILFSKWELKGITNDRGEIVEIQCVGFDITEQIQNLKKAEHLLQLSSEQNFKLKSFAYIVSHNIRSHSANITSLVDFLAEAENPDESEMFINMLKSSTRQLDETIHNLNEIITINENVSKPKEVKYLSEEIQKTLHILSGIIVKESVLVINTVPEHETVRVIASYLDSILLNLLSNAIKYRSPERQPVIELSTYKDGAYKVLVVKDNGLGLNLKKYGSKVFGMYKTFHGNEDARGFGLYITKTQIEAMGGKITLESEVNIGSTFKVYFYEGDE